MSLADNPAAIAAAVEAERESVTKYTLMDINQGPGEGNYDRVQELRIADMLRAAEAAGGVDEQDTMVMQTDTAPDIDLDTAAAGVKLFEDPDFWAAFKTQLPVNVRPSTINCIIAARNVFTQIERHEKERQTL